MERFWTPTRILWAALAGLYLTFLGWYDYSGGPLTPAEIDHYERVLQEQGLAGTRVPDAVRAFAEGDDGGEFYMVNLENSRAEPLIPDDLPPGTDPKEAELRYQRGTALKMLRHANHPVASLHGRVNFIEYAGAPVWENLLLVRYRSRRDFLEVFAHPDTAQAIRYKFVFFGQYHAWPTRTGMSLLGVRSAVAVPFLLLGFGIQWGMGRRARRVAE
jgi:hypothetical protein